MQRWPAPRAMKKIRERVHELTDVSNGARSVNDIITKLNPVLRGWGNCFRGGNADREFNRIDSYVYRRITRAPMKCVERLRAGFDTLEQTLPIDDAALVHRTFGALGQRPVTAVVEAGTRVGNRFQSPVG